MRLLKVCAFLSFWVTGVLFPNEFQVTRDRRYVLVRLLTPLLHGILK